MTVRAQRITTNILAQLADGLTTREQAILATLAIVGVASTEQLARSTIEQVAPDTAARLARRSLQHLREVGLVRRFADRAWDRRAGAPGYVHALTGAGLRLAGGDYAPGVRQRRTWRPTYQFLTHRLGITELYVRLILQERDGGPRLREFAVEAAAARPYRGPGGQPRFLRPDALVRVESAGIEVSHFVELDLSTERQATIAAKCQAYLAYEQSGDEVRRYGIFPGVLFLVPSGKRATAIAAVIARQPLDAQELFAVAVDDQALPVLARVDLPTPADRAPPPVVGKAVGMPIPAHTSPRLATGGVAATGARDMEERSDI